ncbi:uncharacterized protein LOC114353272 [Ostrinia furnacalis]|uniref:uncharacterized protein LOC114353272 n=1 Tax=Ostrinia furnacalis TaxID=93504 RepID=UPI001038EEE6|nr:uncharacterized protein LOC114353272 [Ostrinia furnacalis]
MSDPYIRSLTQKYQLALALAVLREKPQDISIENYIEELKSKINNEPSEDLDLTLCSDDFDMQESPEKLNNDEEKQVLDEQTNNIDNNASQIVTFKVVEELNKVKNYINKRIERRLSNDGSIDSGYRSDSQTKCSFRSSLQLSGNWINQSAHSLFEHITQCPLLGTTHEIIGEISQVLGQLIDKLHEEERYPSFFDELLDNINFLLKDIHQESGGEDVLLQKDEKMQRLLLLNKSMHIQKYTIEKITSLLENVLSHLTNTEKPYEISNINEIENLSYIFHILEVILQRYIRGKNVTSQEITNSQLELKKTSITELWRRKWNPSYREDAIQDFTPKKCVLIHCNEVLNKIVVSCMDGYSLVAFAALNCFNILQS